MQHNTQIWDPTPDDVRVRSYQKTDGSTHHVVAIGPVDVYGNRGDLLACLSKAIKALGYDWSEAGAMIDQTAAERTNVFPLAPVESIPMERVSFDPVPLPNHEVGDVIDIIGLGGVPGKLKITQVKPNGAIVGDWVSEDQAQPPARIGPNKIGDKVTIDGYEMVVTATDEAGMVTGAVAPNVEPEPPGGPAEVTAVLDDTGNDGHVTGSLVEHRSEPDVAGRDVYAEHGLRKVQTPRGERIVRVPDELDADARDRLRRIMSGESEHPGEGE